MTTAVASHVSDWFQEAKHLLARPDPMVVLQVRLVFASQNTEVHLDLRRGDAAPSDEHRLWKVALSTLGVPTSPAGGGEAFSLPAQVIEGLREAPILRGIQEGQPLWLDLLRPYGLLGLLPWEDVLGRAIGRPVLRRPSLLAHPEEDRDVADVALLLCVDPTEDRLRTNFQVRSIVDAVLGRSSRLQTRMHVFAPEPWHGVLLSETFDARVHLHDPVSEFPAEHDGPAANLKPWIDWVSLALKGQSLDTVHIIGEAEPSAVGAFLMLPMPSAARIVPDGTEVGMVAASPEDVCAMSTLLGAWMLAFTPPQDGTSATTLAFFADAAARIRPGPLLFHRLQIPEDAVAMAEAYGFLLSPRPVRAPPLTRGFAYALPGTVAHEASDAREKVEQAIVAAMASAYTVTGRSPLAERLLATATAILPGVPRHEITQVPNWAAATQRFVETATLDELRRASPDVLLSGGTVSLATHPATRAGSLDVVKQTLADIQAVVSKHLAAGTPAVEPRLSSRPEKELRR